MNFNELEPSKKHSPDNAFNLHNSASSYSLCFVENLKRCFFSDIIQMSDENKAPCSEKTFFYS